MAWWNDITSMANDVAEIKPDVDAIRVSLSHVEAIDEQILEELKKQTTIGTEIIEQLKRANASLDIIALSFKVVKIGAKPEEQEKPNG